MFNARFKPRSEWLDVLEWPWGLSGALGKVLQRFGANLGFSSGLEASWSGLGASWSGLGGLLGGLGPRKIANMVPTWPPKTEPKPIKNRTHN